MSERRCPLLCHRHRRRRSRRVLGLLDQLTLFLFLFFFYVYLFIYFFALRSTERHFMRWGAARGVCCPVGGRRDAAGVGC